MSSSRPYGAMMACFRPEKLDFDADTDNMNFDTSRINAAVFDLSKGFSTMQIETGLIAVFQEKAVPPGCKLAGWAALVRTLAIAAPVRCPSCVSEQHVRGSQREEGGWTVFDKRYWPGDTLAGHLGFALRHEDIDLLIFRRLCDAAPADAFADMVRAAPTGNPSRRVWYLYEHLTGRTLPVDDAPAAPAVDLLEPDRYFTGAPRLSRRHRVRDNLLGTGRFCPVIRRTKTLTEYIGLDLAAKARETVGRTGAH